MPIPRFLHRDQALSALGCMPTLRAGESAKSWEHRKGLAASQMERDFGLTAYQVPGKRARRYSEAEVKAAQKLITPLQAA